MHHPRNIPLSHEQKVEVGGQRRLQRPVEEQFRRPAHAAKLQRDRRQDVGHRAQRETRMISRPSSWSMCMSGTWAKSLGSPRNASMKMIGTSGARRCLRRTSSSMRQQRDRPRPVRRQHLKIDLTDLSPPFFRLPVGEGEALEARLGAAQPARRECGGQQHDDEAERDGEARQLQPGDRLPIMRSKKKVIAVNGSSTSGRTERPRQRTPASSRAAAAGSSTAPARWWRRPTAGR